VRKTLIQVFTWDKLYGPMGIRNVQLERKRTVKSQKIGVLIFQSIKISFFSFSEIGQLFTFVELQLNVLKNNFALLRGCIVW